MFSLNPATLIFDFRFEIANAVLASNALNSAIGSISETAKRAEQSMISLGASVLTSMGAIPGSLMAGMGAAIKASEAFDQTALSWANLISANKDVLSGPIGTHEQRMEAAQVIMADITKMSREFGISQKELSDYSKLINANLVQKGLQGTNFEVGHNLARQLLKSAPNLGIDPSLVMGQLIRTIQGGASMGDPLFRALASDTPAMQKFSKAGGAEAFNKLAVEERVRLLNEAMSQFSKDSAVVNARFNSLTGQLQLLKDTMMGFDGILRPVGDKLKNPIVEGMKLLNKELDTNGRVVANNIAGLVGLGAPNLDTLIVNLNQASRLQGTIQTVTQIVGTLGHILFMLEILALGRKFIPNFDANMARMVKLGMGSITEIFQTTREALGPWVTKAGVWVGQNWKAVILAIGRNILAPLALLIPVMLMFDRAIGKAKVADAKAMPGILAQFSEWGLRIAEAFKRIMLPFTIWIEEYSEAFKPLFMVTTWMDYIKTPIDIFVTSMEKIAEVMIYITSAIQAIGQVWGEKMKIGAWSGEWWMNYLPKDLQNQFQMKREKQPSPLGGEGIFDKNWAYFFHNNQMAYLKEYENAKKKVDIAPQQTVNINKVTIENKFKENLEPDRIAFTIRDQLLKAASNATQAKGQTLYPALGK